MPVVLKVSFVSTTASPVTLMALVAVKRASTRLKSTPGCSEKGRLISAVPKIANSRYPSTIS
ncbi:MAG: hypothetical protein BWY65_00607 [Firmicutes bacterium ADurb.Bin373]|nr:MAG: hypothetical protein BWY65_00607 [Firmicutes bacterium ADurb.Bin373]